jgi:hypothetical protein
MTSPTSAKSAGSGMHQADRPKSEAHSGQMRPSQDLMEYFREYARERPEAVALWCLGIGFVLGWKLKPW